MARCIAPVGLGRGVITQRRASGTHCGCTKRTDTRAPNTETQGTRHAPKPTTIKWHTLQIGSRRGIPAEGTLPSL